MDDASVATAHRSSAYRDRRPRVVLVSACSADSQAMQCCKLTLSLTLLRCCALTRSIADIQSIRSSRCQCKRRVDATQQGRGLKSVKLRPSPPVESGPGRQWCAGSGSGRKARRMSSLAERRYLTDVEVPTSSAMLDSRQEPTWRGNAILVSFVTGGSDTRQRKCWQAGCES